MRFQRWVIQVAFFAPAALFIACAADTGDVAKSGQSNVSAPSVSASSMSSAGTTSAAATSAAMSSSASTAGFPTYDSGASATSSSLPPSSSAAGTSSAASASSSGTSATGGADAGASSSSGAGTSSSSSAPLDGSVPDASTLDAAPCTTCTVELKYRFANVTGSDQFTIDIINSGSTPIALSTMQVRYYFAGSSSGWMYHSDSAQIVAPYMDINASVQGAFKASGAATASAKEYLEISFSAAAPTLAPGATAEVQNRFNDTGYTLNQAADYSYLATASTFVDNKKMTVYVSNQLVWGTAPM